MFHVVQYFDAAKSVAVVPQSWYSAGFTLWPNYTSNERINKAVQCAEAPGQNWTRHPVRVLKTYDDYMSAWRGMKKSLTCDTSELDSHDEDSPVGRVKRTPKPIHYYGDTEEESDTECVPKRKAISQEGSTPITHPQQSSASPLSSRSSAPSTRPSSFAAPPLPPQPPPGLFSIAARPPPPPRLSSTAAPPPSPSPPGPSAHAAPPELPPPEPTLTELTSFVTSYTSSFHPPPPGLSSFASQPPLPSFEHFHSSQSTNPLETASEVFMPTLRAGRSGREPIPCTPAELHMLTRLKNLKHQLNQQSSVMNLLMSRLNAACEPASEMPDDISFPLSSLAEVDCFEDWLNDPANAMKKKQMVAVLASLGGRDIKHVTWNILAHIFSSSVAKQINWKGVNNKKKFSEMATKALLARAVRKNHQGEKATDMEINHHSIRWINLASDRGGGRRQRSQQTMSQ